MTSQNNDIDNFNDLIQSLKERKKELECLYEISNVLQSVEESIDVIFEKIIDIIPKGFQFPEYCRVRIEVYNNLIEHDDIVNSELVLFSDIRRDNDVVGEISIFYVNVLEKVPISFLPEEKKLIEAISVEIGRHLTISHFQSIIDATTLINKEVSHPEILHDWLLELDLSDFQIRKILSKSVKFNKNELVLKQGTKVSSCFVLTDGLVGISVSIPGGKNFTIKISKPFDFIGIDLILSNLSWSYSATALVNSQGYIVDKETIEDIINTNITFKNNIIKKQGQSLELLYQKINFLTNRQALGRLANTLVYLSSDVFNSNLIDYTISRKTIADLSGMSTENAVRILSEFKNEKIVSISKKGIKILNLKLLETYSVLG